MHFDDADKRNRLRLLASPDGAEGSATILQDACIFATRPDDGAEVAHTLAAGAAPMCTSRVAARR